MSSPMENLPPELFRFILIYLTAEDTSALALTCQKMNAITRDDKIWRQYVLERYTYTTCTVQYVDHEYLPDATLNFPEPSNGRTWREYFIQRALQDKHIRILLDQIVSTRTKRISNAAFIATNYGVLAFDVLKKYFPPSSNTSDPSIHFSTRSLTREYYSLDVARLISRNTGLNLLRDLRTRREIPTEGKALLNGMFIIQCFHPHGIFLSLNRIHSIGIHLANDPIFSTLDLNGKCQLIISTMRTEKFLPVDGDNEYYDLENSFLYSAFNGKPTIPITLVSIFCALAAECGLITRPVGLPGEVMAQVEQPFDKSVSIIISVFDGKIMSLNELNERLAGLIETPLTYPLPPTSLIELIIRSARNIINSITRRTTSPLNSYGLYAAISVLKILGGGELPFAFDSMMNILKEHFPTDLYFFEILSSPTTTTSDDLKEIRSQDENPLPIEEKRRTDSNPKYFVGQIVQHGQLNYWGVICGWDLVCMASRLWQTRMGVQQLVGGALQPFYHILAEDSSRRYVAEINIDASAFFVIENQELKRLIMEKLCSVDGIGKHFETVDVNKSRFIPNVELRQEYPDDFY